MMRIIRRRHRAWTLFAMASLVLGFSKATIAGDSKGEPAALPVTGEADSRLEAFDRLMIQFMTRRAVPGGALAIAKDGRLVYARGFGYAETESRTPVEPDALFRIASVSKPITAVAVLQLIEQGRLRLIDKVAAVVPIEPYLSDTATFDERLRAITIQQLLQHRGGWDREQSSDPMFQSARIARTLLKSPPAEPDDIVRYTFGRRLDFDPGSRCAYSNFGYCLLGRVIERVSGEDYEDYVLAHVLRPAGITRMRLGRTLPSERADGEVCYYTGDGATGPSVLAGERSAPVPLPYGRWSLEAMDAHGGWIASAVDLVRFASALNEPAHSPLRKSESRALMTMRPAGRAGYEPDGKPKGTYYGCGWYVTSQGARSDKVDLSHTGALDGTSAVLVHRHDGVSWAVLFNTAARAGKKPLEKGIEPLIEEAMEDIHEWPEVDLFEPKSRTPPIVTNRDSGRSATRRREMTAQR